MLCDIKFPMIMQFISMTIVKLRFKRMHEKLNQTGQYTIPHIRVIYIKMKMRLR